MEEENKKIIAEFMEYAPVNKSEIDGFWNSSNKFPNHDYYEIMLSAMKFDTDWNWLMKVVEKIESLNFTTHMQNITGLGYYFRIYSEDADVIELRDYQTKIKSVYKGCLKFINWYNQQNKQ